MSTRAQCRAATKECVNKVGAEQVWKVLAAILNGDAVAAMSAGDDEARLLVEARDSDSDGEGTGRGTRKQTVLRRDAERTGRDFKRTPGVFLPDD